MRKSCTLFFTVLLMLTGANQSIALAVNTSNEGQVNEGIIEDPQTPVQQTSESTIDSTEDHTTATSEEEKVQASIEPDEPEIGMSSKKEEQQEQQPQIRVVEAEATVGSQKELTQALDGGAKKIKVNQSIQLVDSDVNIRDEVVIDWGGYQHNFGINKIFIREGDFDVTFINFKVHGDHNGTSNGSVIQNHALIYGNNERDFLNRPYNFTGRLIFKGSFDVVNKTASTVARVPEGQVEFQGASGNIDMWPKREGEASWTNPGWIYTIRSKSLIVNNSHLTANSLPKFYGRLNSDNGEEDGLGLTVTGGSTLDFHNESGVSGNWEGQIVESDVNGFQLNLDQGSSLTVTSDIKITEQANAGIIQLKGNNSKINVQNNAQLAINSSFTAGLRIAGQNSNLHIATGGKTTIQQKGDNNQSYNAGIRMAEAGLTITVTDKGSNLSVFKESGSTSAIRFESGDQALNVQNGASLEVTNLGDNQLHSTGEDRGSQAVQFVDTSSWWGSIFNPTSSSFKVDGKSSNIKLHAQGGSVVDANGSMGLNFSASKDTFLDLVGETNAANKGIVSGKWVKVKLDNPMYFDFQNKRMGTKEDSGAFLFQGNQDSTLEIRNSATSFWLKKSAYQGNVEGDPIVSYPRADLSFRDADLRAFMSSSIPIGIAEITGSGAMMNVNRISSNNQEPVVDQLVTPTNADQRIYGHVSVPEGVNSDFRDAWTNEVRLQVQVTYAAANQQPQILEIQTKNALSGYNPWGEEKPAGGFFEAILPDGQFLNEGDVVQVISASRISNGLAVTELNTPKKTVDVIPPEPAEVVVDSLQFYSSAVIGKGSAGNKVALWINDQLHSETLTEITNEGDFEITIPANALSFGDKVDVVQYDTAPEVSDLLDRPVTNTELGNRNPVEQAQTYHDKTFEPAPRLLVYGDVELTIPSSISFGSIKRTGITSTTFASYQGELKVTDERKNREGWQLRLKQNAPFVDKENPEISLENVLYYQQAGEQHLIDNNYLEIASGKNSNPSSVELSDRLGDLMLILDYQNQQLGNFTTELNWELADVPTND